MNVVNTLIKVVLNHAAVANETVTATFAGREHRPCSDSVSCVRTKLLMSVIIFLSKLLTY